jgi:hypothetical protein
MYGQPAKTLARYCRRFVPFCANLRALEAGGAQPVSPPSEAGLIEAGAHKISASPQGVLESIEAMASAY